MSQYTTGTVDVTNGSQIVTGIGTLWLGEITAGDLFIVTESGVIYFVGSVDSDTQITLSANYAGPTDESVSYVIARDFTPNKNLPFPTPGDIETSTILKRSLSLIDEFDLLHDFTEISGQIADAQVPVSAVTQHEGAIDHGSLAGLSDNDHPQYALLTGANFSGAITAASYGGITEANLLDKTATENITGLYTMRRNTLSFRVESSSTSGVDSRIEIRGARNGSTGADTAELRLLNFDNNEGTGTEYALAAVVGRMADVSGATGLLVLRTNPGTGLEDQITIDKNGNTDISGNITLTGTVDGRDVAADGTKLDGIESGATADQTITLSGDASGSGTTSIAVTVANDSHTHTGSTISGLDTGDTTTGTFADARIAQSNVTQHQAAIDHGSLSGLGDNDHPQYALLTGAAFTGTVTSPLLSSSSTTSTRDKLRVYPSSNYTIGMQSGITFGGLGDWAMTFQFSDDADRGFWWGDTAHTTAQGAMSLTTDGKLAVAHSMRLGYGEADTTTPGATYRLDVSGAGAFSGNLFIGGDTTGHLRSVTGQYGSIEVTGNEGSSGGWNGYSIEGRFVLMSNGGNNVGIYNDVDNEWMIQCSRNAWTSLYYNGSNKLQTTNTGANVSGDIAATTFAGIAGANLLSRNSDETIAGEYNFTGARIDFTGSEAVDTRRGISGSYGDNADSSSNWGANIWAMGDAFSGAGHGSSFTNTGASSRYGLSWLRNSHPQINSDALEGLYLYRAGTRYAAFGYAGAVIDTTLDVNGAITATSYGGITEANLLDKSATETVSGAYTFSASPVFSDEIHAQTSNSPGTPAYSFSSDTDCGMYRSTTNTIGWSTAGVNRMTLNATALTVTGDVSGNSDIILKDDLEVIPDALQKVEQISGYTFTRNDSDDQRRRAGVIAQEIEKILPEVVTENEAGIKSVAYGNLTALLIEAVKELNAKVARLEGKQ